MAQQEAGTLAKRRFVIDIGVGGPDQDVIDRLQEAENYSELVVRAVRQYRKEDPSYNDKRT